ncbi:daunorubicin/doxorubicin resistance ABC transporter ATP-binding protein DrrA, partial [Streptomyces cavourensis]|nr:daunorubicin/doxorubicin resistance ABC transporter ATP-binding protein DrrA [Streptomyces cavourensis]
AGRFVGGPLLRRERPAARPPAPDRMAALTRAVRALQEAGIEAEDIAVRRPTLDEVFLSLTGRPAGGRTAGAGHRTAGDTGGRTAHGTRERTEAGADGRTAHETAGRTAHGTEAAA